MKIMKKRILSISLIVLIVFTLLFVFVKNNIADVLALEESNYDNISLTNGDKKSDDVILIEGTNGSGSSFTKGLRSDLTDVKFISNANYFLLNPKHHKNNGSDNKWGTCTTVAMQLLLGYHNYYSDRRIIPSSFLSADYGKVEFDPFFNRLNAPWHGCEKIGTGDGVYDEIFSRTFIAEVPGIGQMIPSVVNGTKSFINEYAADEIVDDITIAFGAFSSAQAREDIDNGLPIVLGMNLLLEAEMHVVPAYGYAKLNGVSGFLVHYGWGDGTRIFVWISGQNECRSHT